MKARGSDSRRLFGFARCECLALLAGLVVFAFEDFVFGLWKNVPHGRGAFVEVFWEHELTLIFADRR